MNYEQAKIASFYNGFDTRMQQLMVKSAVGGWGRLGGLLSRFRPNIRQTIQPAIPAAGLDLAGGAGTGIGAILGVPVSGLRAAAKGYMGTAARPNALNRIIGRAGQRFLGSFGQRGQRVGERFYRYGTGRIGFGAPRTVNTAAPAANPFSAQAAEAAAPGRSAVGPNPMSGAPSPGQSISPDFGAPDFAPPARAATPAAAPAPGTTGGGKTPGSISNEELSNLGLGRPSGTISNDELIGLGLGPGSRGGGRRRGFFDLGSGNPTGGLVDRIKSWTSNNPDALPFGAGVLGGGVPMYAGHAYANNRRRSELENANWMQRLGLAYQLATNPQGFSDTLRL